MGDTGGQTVASGGPGDKGGQGTLAVGFEVLAGFQLTLKVWWKPLRVEEEVLGTDRASPGQGDEGRQAWGRSTRRDSWVN